MSVSDAEVRRIAELARLRLDEDEIRSLTTDLNAILEHVDALSGVDSAALSDLAPQLGAPLPSTRAGEGEAPDALECPPEGFAPEWRDGFFVVPPPPGVQRSPADPAVEDR